MPYNEAYECICCRRTNWRALRNGEDRPSDTDGIWSHSPCGVGIFERKPPGYMYDHKHWLSIGQRRTFEDFLWMIDPYLFYVEFRDNVPWQYPANFVIINKTYGSLRIKPRLDIANSTDDIRAALRLRRGR